MALPPPTPSSVPPINASNNHKPPIEKPIAPGIVPCFARPLLYLCFNCFALYGINSFAVSECQVASPPTISIDISPPDHPVIPKLTPSSSPGMRLRNYFCHIVTEMSLFTL